MLLPLGSDSTLLPDLRNGRWLLLSGAAIVTTVGPDSPALRAGARAPLGADRAGHVLLTMSIGGAAAPAREATMPRLDSTQLVRARVAVDKDVVVVGFGRSMVFTSATDENGLQRLQRRPFPVF